MAMDRYDVTVFEPFPFEIGQKIRIEGGKRQGDWEVVGISDAKVKLRCPISNREFEWVRFCYRVHEQKDAPWPKR